MKNTRTRTLHLSPFILLTVLMLQGCLIGQVMDSAGAPIANLGVVAITNCAGAGCVAHQTQVTVGSQLQTGYRTTTNTDGYYTYDPYAVTVAAQDAMFVYPLNSAVDKAVKLLFSQSGYQSVLLSHVPVYTEHVDTNTGKKYQIAEAPDVYMCRIEEFDSDFDGLCDEAEKRYGTSHLNPDTDRDGVTDYVELYEKGTSPGTLDVCVFAYCQSDVLGCLADSECSEWLECMEGCGEEAMLCPTQCGAFYQSPVIDSLSECALGNGCAFVEFPELEACTLPAADEVSIGNIEGFWWVSAIKGADYVLFDDCQRFIFSEQTETRITVEGSTLVTVNNSTETRVAIYNGQFTPSSEGYLELEYDNWKGYKEQYHPYYATDNAMVMHVCSVGTNEECHEYATLILTRVALAQLSAAEMTSLDAALQSLYGNTLADFHPIRNDNCPNAL